MIGMGPSFSGLVLYDSQESLTLFRPSDPAVHLSLPTTGIVIVFRESYYPGFLTCLTCLKPVKHVDMGRQWAPFSSLMISAADPGRAAQPVSRPPVGSARCAVPCRSNAPAP